jgi:hypothetical protein
MVLPPAKLAASRLYVIPVEFVAVAVYVTEPAPWQRVDTAPSVNTGIPTVGVIVTVWVAVRGPPQPAALAVTTVDPDQPAAYVTSPVVALIVLPPAILGASRLYVIPVVLVAVAVYVTEVAPWQRVDVAPNVKTGNPTVGVIVTVWVAVTGPLHPAALAVITVAPVQPATYVTAPVAALIVLPPASAGAFRLYVIPVELEAVAVYVTDPAPWQRVDVAPRVNTGVPTFGLMVTVWLAVVGPLQPVAVAVITEVPVHPAVYVTAPVAVLIVLPPAMLAASRL